MSTFERVGQLGRAGPDTRPRQDEEERVCGGPRPSGSAPSIHRGLQIVGDSFKEEHILKFGHAHEQTTDRHSRQWACLIIFLFVEQLFTQ